MNINYKLTNGGLRIIEFYDSNNMWLGNYYFSGNEIIVNIDYMEEVIKYLNKLGIKPIVV